MKIKEKPTEKKPLIFATPYHPHLPKIKQTFQKFDYILDNDPDLKQIFPKPPMVTYRRCPTLRDLLVKSQFKSTEPKQNPGFTKCNRRGYTTCKFSKPCKFFESMQNKQRFEIIKPTNCCSTNIIYLITCTKCKKQYVGETGRKLKNRVTDHLGDIRRNENTAVGQHFNLTGHSVNDFSVCAIDKLYKSTQYRKNKELWWISKLDTVELLGLNIRE